MEATPNGRDRRGDYNSNVTIEKIREKSRAMVPAGRVSDPAGTSWSDRDSTIQQTSEPACAHPLRSCDDSLGLTPQTARFPFDSAARELCSRKYQFSCNKAGIAGGIFGIVKPVENCKHERQPAGLIRCRSEPCWRGRPAGRVSLQAGKPYAERSIKRQFDPWPATGGIGQELDAVGTHGISRHKIAPSPICHVLFK